MKKNLFIVMAFFASIHSFGQGEIDAYRFSKNELSGTARGQAMGGAFGALGGDATGVAVNPAGIGVYRSSEIIFNAGLTFNQTKADFEGTKESKGNTNLSCDNFTYMGYFPLGNDDRYSLNFGFNYNRLKSFDRKYNVSGKEMGSSLTDYMADITFRTPWSFWDKNEYIEDQFYASEHPHWLGILGWNGYLINEKPEYDGEYVSILNEGEKVAPHLQVREKGYVGAYDFTLGTNLDNKVYLGATVTCTGISYIASTSYGEDFAEGGSFNLNNEYSTEGSGLQVKLGAIFRPTDAFRLGVSYHSPTWYNLTDYYWGQLSPYGIYNERDELVETVSTPANAYYEYKFKTPDVWTLSAALVLGQVAIISLDYEYKNYGRMEFSKQYQYDDYDFKLENGYINDDFKGASTIRAGVETRFTPQFSGRWGFAWMQNPYDSQFRNSEIEVVTPGTIPNYTLEGDALYLTTGVGFRFTPRFYMDLALVYRTQEDELHFFSPVFYDYGKSLASTPSRLTNSSLKTLVTLGYKF